MLIISYFEVILCFSIASFENPISKRCKSVTLSSFTWTYTDSYFLFSITLIVFLTNMSSVLTVSSPWTHLSLLRYCFNILCLSIFPLLFFNLMLQRLFLLLFNVISHFFETWGFCTTYIWAINYSLHTRIFAIIHLEVLQVRSIHKWWLQAILFISVNIYWTCSVVKGSWT